MSSYRRYSSRDPGPSIRDSVRSALPSSTRRSLSHVGDASTTGTSWGSLRFGKSMTDGPSSSLRDRLNRYSSAYDGPSGGGKSSSAASSSYAPSTGSTATLASSRYSTTTARDSASRALSPPSGYVRSALANYQKAVEASDRPGRTRTSVAGPLMTYRSQTARDMFSPSRYVATSEPRSTSLASGSSSYLGASRADADSRSRSTGRTNYGGTSYTTPNSSLSRVTSSSLLASAARRPSTYDNNNDNLSLAVTKALNNRVTPKADRPWRQRMADAARIRNYAGADAPTSTVVSRLAASRAQRRSSIGQNSGDELQHSIESLKSYVADPMASDRSSAISKYRARNGNPLDTSTASTSTPTVPFRHYRTSGYGKTLADAQTDSLSVPGALSARPSSMGVVENLMSRSYSPIRTARPLLERFSSHEHVPSLGRTTTSSTSGSAMFRDKGQTILEEIQERWGGEDEAPPPTTPKKKPNPRSAKERTARHNSRNRSLSREPPKSSSSSEDDEKAGPGGLRSRRSSRDPPKKRRLVRKHSSNMSKLPPELPSTAKASATVTIPAATKNEAKTPAAKTTAAGDKAQPGGATTVDPSEPLTVKTDTAPASPAPQPASTTMGVKQSKPSPLQRVLAPFLRKVTKPPVVVEAGAPSPSAVITVETAPTIEVPTTSDAAPKAVEATPSPRSAVVSISVSDNSASTAIPDSSIVDDDESKYNAVAEFRPAAPKRTGKAFKVKSSKPVPGLWQQNAGEINISCNRRFTRKTVSNLAASIVIRDSRRSKAALRRVKAAPTIRKKAPSPSFVEKHLEVVLVGHPKPPRESAFKALKLKRPVLTYKVTAKFKPPPIPVTAVAVLNQEIAALKASKPLRAVAGTTLPEHPVASTSFTCNASGETVKNVDLNVNRKEEKRAARVTVIAVDVMDVNWSTASKRVKMPITPAAKKALIEVIEQQAAIIDSERVRLAQNFKPESEDDDISLASDRVETQASLVLSSLRNAAPRIVDDDEQTSIDEDFGPPSTEGPLILPDQSVLEAYVRRKRGEFERLRSEPVRSPSRTTLGAESPCLSTTSELVHPCAVRIVEPSRAVAQFSAPNRNRVDSVESVSLPCSNRNSGMLDFITAANNGFESNGNGGFRASLRRPVPRKESLNTHVFDTPKTPFEAAMQNQANQMLKKQVNVNDEDISIAESLADLPQHRHHQRRPSIESTQSMPPITASSGLAHGFATAAALASQPRHERYAAHIPVRQPSVEPGRQSTTSIDSGHSGVLDTATRQLDQVIDQARFRHHQHRSKFKEAIDYLDQIFEDLNKDMSPPTSTSAEKKPEAPVGATRGIQAAKAVFQPSNGIQRPIALNSSSSKVTPPTTTATTNVPVVRLRKPSDLAASSTRQQPQSTSTSMSTVVPAPPQSNTTTAKPVAPLRTVGPKPFPKLAKSSPLQQTSGDVEITETIVLPSKSNPEKMDFTRQWLSGDIKSWAEKPDLIVASSDLTSPNDSDDRSIGSCSAEVAAINAADRRRKRQVRETPDIIKSSKTNQHQHQHQHQHQNQHQQMPQPQVMKPKPTIVTPIKPQPMRPAPQYAPFPTNGQLLNVAMDSSPSGSLQKTPSHEYVRPQPQQGNYDRAGSQDYQSLGSVHSQEGYKPPSSLSLYSNSLQRGGAFQQYSTRGSIHSLPDATSFGRNQNPSHVNPVQQDPILAIDALVAELELNTDPNGTDKRRSFPTADAPIPISRQNLQPQYPRGPGGVHRIASTNGPRHASIGMAAPAKTSTGSMDRNYRQMRANHNHHQPVKSSQKASLDEMANMLTHVAGDLKPLPSPRRMAPASSVLHGPKTTPFETINAERIGASRVNAMQQMFETKNTNNNDSWRTKPKPSVSKEEENYYEINEYSRMEAVSANKAPKQHYQHPPTVPPPPAPSSSANSSQHGYYSSSASSLGRANSGSNPPVRRGSFAGKHSISSRAASFDDDEEDDGFYDNIGVDVDRRMSEADNASIQSHQLPPTQKSGSSGPGRLGQLIRRIGGHGRPPMTASSTVSLNRMGLEAIPTSSGHPLTKSNSLSNEPWREIIEGDYRPHVNGATRPRLASNASSNNSVSGFGFGQRLKQSIFGGSKRRLF
uniref:Protein kinase domain-containing protein n=1 Tax=Panagrellus redivivus TaxID=6233 RepID=A0A7E4W3R6_PANRE